MKAETARGALAEPGVQAAAAGRPRGRWLLGLVVPVGLAAGWEAAVLDHFQALVTTVCQVLRGQTSHAQRDNVIGGYTYTFDVWPDHPHAEEVYGLLARHRAELSELRTRIDAYNHAHGRLEGFEEVVVYGGQTIHLRDKRRGESQRPPEGKDGA